MKRSATYIEARAIMIGPSSEQVSYMTEAVSDAVPSIPYCAWFVVLICIELDSRLQI